MYFCKPEALGPNAEYGFILVDLFKFQYFQLVEKPHCLSCGLLNIQFIELSISNST